MNIDVVQPHSRLELSPLKCSVVETIQNTLWIGTVSGQVHIYPIEAQSDRTRSESTINEARNEARNGARIGDTIARLNSEDDLSISTPKMARSLKSYKSLNDMRLLFSKSLLLQVALSQAKIASPVQAIVEVNDNDNETVNEDIGNYDNFIAGRSDIDKSRNIRRDSSYNETGTFIAAAVADLESVGIYTYSDNLELQQTLDVKGTVAMTYLKSRRLLLVATNTKKVVVFCLVLAPNNKKLHFQHIINLLFKAKIGALEPFDESKVVVSTTSSFVVIDVDADFKLDDLVLGDNNYFALGSSFSYFALNSTPISHIVKEIKADNIQIKPLKEPTSNFDHLYFLIKDNTIVRWTPKQGSEGKEQVSLVNIKSSASPLKVLFLTPCYLLLVFPKKFEIIDSTDGDVIQSFYHQVNSNLILAALARKSGTLFLASGSEIFQYEILSTTKQIKQFLKTTQDTNPIGKTSRDRDLKLWAIEKAIKLAVSTSPFDKYFTSSIKQSKFKTSEVALQLIKAKELKLRELYGIKAQHLFIYYEQYHKALVEIASDWILDFRSILSLFPDYVNSSVLLQRNSKFEENVVDSVNKVKSTRLEDIQDLEGQTNDSSTETDNATTTKKPGNADALRKNALKITQRRFNRATSNLIIFLTEQRRILQNFMSNSHEIAWHNSTLKLSDLFGDISIKEIAQIIDTSLFLCYFYIKPMMLGPLLRLPNNHCDSKIVNDCLLRDLHKHDVEQPAFIKELLDFYYGRSLHKEALEMLYKLAHDNVVRDHEDELDNFLKQPSLTIQYLQKLDNNNLDLVFHFSRWVLNETKKSSELNQRMKLLFMNDSIECETYDVFRVVEFISEDIKNLASTIRYMEWLILDTSHIKNQLKKASIQKLHTKLCLSYLKQLIEEDKGNKEDIRNTTTYKKLLKFLGTTQLYEPWTVLKYIPSEKQNFLMFTVMIYRRLGEHEKSIDVLFNQLDDLDAAMDYCSDIYNQPHNKKTGVDLLHKLLEDLLINAADDSQAQGYVSKLLDSQGQKMSMVRVLDALPADFSIINVANYLSCSLRTSKEELYDSRLINLLYKIGLTKLKSQVLEKKNEKVIIPNSRQLCSVCQKKLGYSVYSLNNLGHVSHYGCSSNPNAI